MHAYIRRSGPIICTKKKPVRRFWKQTGNLASLMRVLKYNKTHKHRGCRCCHGYLFSACIHFAPIIRAKNAPPSCFRVSGAFSKMLSRQCSPMRASLHQNAINISAARLIIKNLQPRVNSLPLLSLLPWKTNFWSIFSVHADGREMFWDCECNSAFLWLS